MESRAILRGFPSSPRKMRLVVDLIRNKKVTEARAILHLATKHAAKPVLQTLNSAVSNYFRVNEDNSRTSEASLVVTKVFVDQGLTIKRISPAPMGRGYRVRKRSNHLTIIVAKHNSIN